MLSIKETYETIEENGFTLRKKIIRIKLFGIKIAESHEVKQVISWP